MHTSSHQQPPPPPSQPIMVVLSCADECEITSALWLRSVSDCLSDTCSDSARSPRRLPATPLGPSASRLLSTVPQFQSAACDRLTCSEAEAVRTRLPGTLLSVRGPATWLPAVSHVSSPGCHGGVFGANSPNKFSCMSADLSPGS